MADFHKEVGNGTMMIRDTGGWVEYWFRAHSTATWHNDQMWGFGANGAYREVKVPIDRGANWKMMGSDFVSSSQPVLFRIFGAGLGWATTDFVVDISRGRVPDPPHAPYFGNVTDSTIHVAFDYAYDGGLPILEAQVGIAGPGVSGWHDGRDRVFSGLYSGSEYLFFGRVRNALGWSLAGGQSKATTKRVPNAPQPPEAYGLTQTSAYAKVREPLPWDGGAPILEFQVGYGLDPGYPQAYVGASAEIKNLQRAARYYFWARARNVYGWGPWSGRTDVLLNAGAYVNVAGVWKRAIPWVKTGGVWKIAQPNIPVNGAWRVPRS